MDSLHTHDGITKLLEQLPLQGLGEEIPPHLRGGPESNLQISFTNLVCKEEVTDVQCPGPLAGALLSIGLKKDIEVMHLVPSDSLVRAGYTLSRLLWKNKMDYIIAQQMYLQWTLLRRVRQYR